MAVTALSGQRWQGITASDYGDITGVTYVSEASGLTADPTKSGLYGIKIENSGAYFFGCFGSTDSVYRYDLSTPYDISTATSGTLAQNYDADGETLNPTDIWFKPDGTKCIF